MKNTLENKAKFFAQYLGQKVLLSEEGDLMTVGLHSSTWRYDIKNYKLQLKPFSQITDEDAIEAAKIMDWFPLNERGGKVINPELIEEFKNTWYHILDWETSLKGQLDVTDFIRSRGYALPYMGIPIEQQIEYGWVKLVEPNNK